MMNRDAENTARTLVADGKGILAADETQGTLTRRFDALGFRSTEQRRRPYREMLFTAPNAARFISGVIMQDETIRQKSSTGTPLSQLLASRGIVAGIKVDSGAKPLALAPDERPSGCRTSERDQLAARVQALEDQLLLRARPSRFRARGVAHGRDEKLNTAQQALSHRARCNGAASLGRYTGEMEASSASLAQFHEAHDD